MTTVLTRRMQQLASSLQAEGHDVQVEFTDFTSGGSMLDVRRADGRMFVMAYGDSFGFGVDEVRQDDGWRTNYGFTTNQFDSAAERLRELVENGGVSPRRAIGLNLVVVYSRDMTASRAFYECLGLKFETERHGTGPQHLAAPLNGTVFEIYPCTEGRENGSVRIGFQVVSVEQIVKELRTRGCHIIAEPKPSPWGRRAVVQDPEGIRVELTEPCNPTQAIQ